MAAKEFFESIIVYFWLLLGFFIRAKWLLHVDNIINILLLFCQKTFIAPKLSLIGPQLVTQACYYLLQEFDLFLLLRH